MSFQLLLLCPIYFNCCCSEGVTRAMLAVPRGSFVPPDYQAEAWVDSPIRVSNSAGAVLQCIVHLTGAWVHMCSAAIWLSWRVTWL
jgi:protein-L-isoaspartate O-methyltransferase